MDNLIELQPNLELTGNPELTNGFDKPRFPAPESKRFALSREPFAKDRIKGLKYAIQELNEEYSETLSFVIYGSTVKGYAKETSDLDGYLFVDNNLAQERFPNQDTIDTFYRNLGRDDTTTFIKPIDNFYRNLLVSKIKEKTELQDNQLYSVEVLPISNQIIDYHIEGFIEDINTNQNRSFLFEKMFYLETGGKIANYRKYFLDRLSDMGDTGEKIWNIVINRVEKSEQGPNYTPGNKKYPQTLEEAKKIYIKENQP